MSEYNICLLSSSTPSERVVVKTTEIVQRELDLFSSARHRQEVVRIKNCPVCNGQAVSLLVGLVFSKRKLILLDCPITYCLREKCAQLTEEDLAAARLRLTDISKSDFVPLDSKRGGVGGVIAKPMLEGDIRSALRIEADQQIFYSSAANALSFYADPAGMQFNDLPDSVAFHSNGLPESMTLKFEPTTRCNFKCEFCYGRYIAQGDLSFDDFVSILDRLPFLKAIELTGEGEPLLNKHIMDMLRRCNERGLWTHITTNGSLLPENTCRKLLSTGLDSFAVSLESFRSEQFGLIRIGGKFEKVISGIRRMAELRKEREKPLLMSLWVTILKDTLSQIDEIAAFANEVGIETVGYQVLNPMTAYARFYTPELRRNMLTVPEMEQIVNAPATSQALRAALSGVIAMNQGKRCDIFMNMIMANWQGYVTPCCLLKVPAFPPLGNLALEDFETIWNNEDFRFFRFALQHGVVLKSCMGCSLVAAS